MPIVVITGGTAGIGRATARHFAKNRFDVAVMARGQDRLTSTEKELRDLGVRCLAIQCDVADAAQLEAAADRIENELGPIDIWINNAMASVFASVDEIKPEEFRRVTEVTYLGQVYGTLAALKRMKPRNKGVVILVGSALAYRESRSKAPTARPSTRFRALPIRCVPSCCTKRVESGWPWCSFRG